MNSVAEIVLAAGVKLKIRGQHAAIFVEKRDQAAVMIEMAVADDQGVNLFRVYAQQLDIVQERVRRVSVIEHQRARFAGFHRLQE